MLTTNQKSLPKVILSNGNPTTTSLNVSLVFEKQHNDVLRKIDNLTKEVPQDFNERNFTLVSYTDAKGEKRPMYTLTRDGFMLLAMGFTGKKAMQFKLAYIEAFNAMEAELKKQQAQAALPQEPQAAQDQGNKLSTVNERVRINNLVRIWAKSCHIPYKNCWGIIHREFGISTIAKLRSNQIQTVCNFIIDKMDDAGTRPTPPPLPEAVQCTLPAPKPELTFLPAEQKLPPLMFEYEPADWKKDWVEFHAGQMQERYGYKAYAYNAYMLSCKAADIFDDFEKKIKELMKDYAKISKPVYEEMFSKVMDGDYDDLHNASNYSRDELDKHNFCVNFTSAMRQTIDNTYAKFMYSRSGDLRNEVNQMLQTLRHTAKVLDM